MNDKELRNKVTDELVYMREQARLNKEYTLSDEIRNILDERGSFILDGADGQIIYHLGKGYTRETFLKELKDLDMGFELNR